MSRIIVKGLPQYYTEDKLRTHFTHDGKYEVTDVKLMRKRGGESRRFAFIGYKNEDDAEAAVRYFHNSFIDTARVNVQVAKSFADDTVPLLVRERQKRARQALEEQEARLEEQQRQRPTKQRKYQSLDDEINANPQLREFMGAINDKRSWADNAGADGLGGPLAQELESALDGEATAPAEKLPEIEMAEDAASDDEYQTLDNKKDEDEDEEMMMPLSGEPTTANDEQKGEDEDAEIAEGDGLAKDENVSDLDWLIQRRKRMKENQENEEQEAQEEEESKEAEDATTEDVPEAPPRRQKETPEDQILATGRLFIRNILYTSTEDDFSNLFSQFGSLEEVHIAVDTRTGKSKGFVYIQFSNPKNAVEAFHTLDKTIFQGRLLHILPGKAKKDHTLDEFDLKNMPLKKQRELKRKQQASKTQFSWNSLYMSTDAVMELVAAKMGVTKWQLLDPHNSLLAVKQALAEADVIGEVRRYFESHGVDLTQFETQKHKDDKIILVKNFAHGTTPEEIGELFAPYGAIKRILMPPRAATIAIVEFRDQPSARSAFSKLLYRRFKDGILYLEKGPTGLFTREPTAKEVEVVENTAKDTKEEPVVEIKPSVDDVVNAPAEDEEEKDVITGPTVSVFVKNLNFTTTNTELTRLFGELPGFVVAVVKTKPNPKKEGTTMSMGFGFVEFRTRDQAETAIRTLDGYVLDGHKIQLKISHRPGSLELASKDKKKAKSSKVIIKNLPFEATRKDVVELLGAFGQLKLCRVPKKFDKLARGFAFVEFNLAKEAEAAMDQLKGVHLLGRRLVMQYAEEDSELAEAEIEKMMQKVKKQKGTRELAQARAMGKGKQESLEDDEDEGF